MMVNKVELNYCLGFILIIIEHFKGFKNIYITYNDKLGSLR